MSGMDRDVTQPVVDALVERVRRGEFSSSACERARPLLEAIVGAAAGRGHGFESRTDAVLGFRIRVRTQVFGFALAEEADLVDLLADEDVAAMKYSWQRVTLRQVPTPSGRLRLGLDHAGRRHSWADTGRWRLESRIPHLLTTIEQLADAADGARERALSIARTRRHAWEEAMTAARDRYIDAYTRDRIERQRTAWERASSLRRYAACLDALVGPDNMPATTLRDWIARVRVEADRVDPTSTPDELAYLEPTRVDPTQLQPFMPAGFSASDPPPDPSSSTVIAGD